MPVPWILWAAMLLSQLLITGVSFVVPTQPGDTLIASSMPLFALGAGAASLSVPMWFKGEGPAAAQTRLILRCATAEAATLFGFVAYMLSGTHTVQALCVTVGVVCVGLAAPRSG